MLINLEVGNLAVFIGSSSSISSLYTMPLSSWAGTEGCSVQSPVAKPRNMCLLSVRWSSGLSAMMCIVQKVNLRLDRTSDLLVMLHIRKPTSQLVDDLSRFENVRKSPRILIDLRCTFGGWNYDASLD